MHRLSTVDRCVAFSLLAVWAVCFALSVQIAINDTGLSAVYAEPGGADEYPVFEGMRPPVTTGSSGLLEGDVLIQLGDVDLRGLGRIDLYAAVADQSRGLRELPVVYERAGRRVEALVPLEPRRMYWPMLPAAASLALVAGFGLVRVRPTRLTRIGFLAFLTNAIHMSTLGFTNGAFAKALFPVYFAAIALGMPLMIMTAQRFPHGREPKNALQRWLPWLSALHSLLVMGVILGTPLPGRFSAAAVMASSLLWLVWVIGVLLWNYRSSDAIGRRQMRWVVLGGMVPALPMGVAFTLAIFDERYIQWAFATQAIVAILPICLLVAISRYNLFDVDRLLTAAVSYNIVLFTLLGGILLIVPRLANAASDMLGTDSPATQTLLSLALIGAVVPAQRRLRVGIERVFFKEHREADGAFAALVQSLAGCPDAGTLFARLGEGVESVLRPLACAVYAPDGDVLTPIYANGRALPPAIDRTGPLFVTLSRGSGALALGASGNDDSSTQIGPFERAALESLGAEAVLPVLRAGELVAVMCLGEKRSGDVYTSTDLSWLRTLGDRATVELDRFDQRRILDESHAMQAQLRRYVPGAVAEQIEEGQELEASEREVAVLFVDIRGYTSFSEGRDASEIFSTVNAYTEKVSEIVNASGGAVVEFNGDGMMAVFGAPREIPEKERAAVSAGRAMLSEIPGIPVLGQPDGLRVGVGVSTGLAFVGNIRAADRWIWSAIGNTTNLAARLQALSRDHAAGMIVDEATFGRLGTATDGFERIEGIPIRGRSDEMVIFALPETTVSEA